MTEEDGVACNRELASRYDPAEVEAKWVQRWVREPFTADAASDRVPFCIVIPPPNVTGNLHLGHAFDNAIIDTLIRFKRMQGYEALFQPGTDHAGISTQVQVEKALREEGISRHELGREAFLQRVWEWKERFGGIILEQLQRLGISADWTRTRFTMDEGLSRAVRKQFVDLYHQGLIYRGERIVNWDPISQTTLSDLEVEREERAGKLYTLAYQLEESGLEESGEIRIATVRPETIFADQAVAVHPNDDRYRSLVGKRVRIPLTDRWVPVITDEAVEMEFGTGALKITPAHDPTDFEIGERHRLERPSVIDLEAKLKGELVPERFRGMDRFEARSAVVEALRSEGTLVEERHHTIPIGLSQRTNEPVEPILSTQWWFRMGEVAPKVLEGLDRGDMRLHPDRYEKVNREWLTNLRDWNISRQLWWGHQIPAWYDDEGNVYVPSPDDPYTDPTALPENSAKRLTQDPDVFDTWFSSNLWPFSTLGWPNEEDPFFRKFYPTSVLVTGYDILFFWVTKMQLAGYQHTGRAPFSDIMLHGLVLDAQGQKMSKSKGNGIDPLDVINEHGADALRFATTHASTGGQDVRWDDRRVEMGRNFNNKLWNATRFALMNLEGDVDHGAPSSLPDRWILSRLQRATAEMTRHLEAFDLGMANRAAYDFVWSEFCDWYLEAAKPALKRDDPRTRAVLHEVLEALLRLLHPLVPFITSELWETLGHEEQIALAPWPLVDESQLDEAAEREFELLQEAVGALRTLRSEANLQPGQVVPIHAVGEGAKILEENREVFESLGRVELRGEEASGPTLTQPLPTVELLLPLAGLVDVEEWRTRQEKRLGELLLQQERSEKKLSSPGFIKKAPEAVVEEERRRVAEAKMVMERLRASLERLT
ncbi:MAG: valine--tRNA ligase [Trueperaceae bacterium]